MNVKIKKLSEKATIPSYNKAGDAGLDLVAISKSKDRHGNVVYNTGLAFEIPEGFVGLLYPRSSIAKYALSLTNHVGVIDSGYRGEITFKFKPQPYFTPFGTDDHPEFEYEVGDRIGQLIVTAIPYITLQEVDELSETERGIGAYGSTGK